MSLPKLENKDASSLRGRVSGLTSTPTEFGSACGCQPFQHQKLPSTLELLWRQTETKATLEITFRDLSKSWQGERSGEEEKRSIFPSKTDNKTNHVTFWYIMQLGDPNCHWAVGAMVAHWFSA